MTHQVKDLRETLAAAEHERWSGWMRHMFRKCKSTSGLYMSAGPPDAIIPGKWVERWMRQMDTPYEDLNESEKNSDRKEVDMTLAIVSDHLLALAKSVE